MVSAKCVATLWLPIIVDNHQVDVDRATQRGMTPVHLRDDPPRSGLVRISRSSRSRALPRWMADNEPMAMVSNIPNPTDTMMGQGPIPFCVARLCFVIPPNCASYDESAPAYTDIRGICHRVVVIVPEPAITVARAPNVLQAMEMFERLQKLEDEAETAYASRHRPPVRLRRACASCSRHRSPRFVKPV